MQALPSTQKAGKYRSHPETQVRSQFSNSTALPRISCGALDDNKQI